MPQRNAARPKHPRTRYFVDRGVFEGLEGFTNLEDRIAALPTEKERGDAFEAFAEAYLATQKLVAAEEVWPANQVPITVLQACCLPIKDMGADGVYKTWGGQFNAYQSKFRTDRPSLTWQELSTFMGLTDQVGERVLFTNCDDLPAVMDARSGFYCIRGTDLDRLTKDDLGAIADWLRGAAFTPKRQEPRPHQVEALENILTGLDESDRVTAVMACATGKTLVSLWLAERRNAKRVLVLVPSLALIRQTLHEWLKETEWEQPRFIAVCSDPTVAQGAEDALVVHQRDLDFPVTTDVGEVREFLAASGNGVQIVFSTYQSAHVVGEAAQDIDGFDVGIFDEAHKTAGREGAKFGFALDDRHVQIAKRVFLTATPRHYDVRKRDKEGDKALVYSMDVPATYGPRVHTLTFAEAARRGIICNYKIIISVVTSEMVNADLLSRGEVIVQGDVVRARTVANQIAIQKACEAHDLKKIFSFHRSVASARDFTGDTSSSIKPHLPDYATYHVNGEMQTARREKEMRAFREANHAIMSNARCLTEGVDVPAVDVVAFLSPRKSKVDIVQAAGRAMRKADGKETGYVLLPLFLETQENETIEDALERTDFEEAWDALQAMQEQDAVLAEIIREMREERGHRGGFDDSRLRERVEVLGPEVSLDVLRSAVSTALVDRLGVNWDERYGELKRYKERFGDCKVPAKWVKNPQLGSWVAAQRWREGGGRLSAERRRRLDEIGFDWDPKDSAWEAKFAELKLYKEQCGDCNVPPEWVQNPQLANWVTVQRVFERRALLSSERQRRLDELGFDWGPRDSAWEGMFAELKRYKQRFGHCNVPARCVENPQLGSWVAVQRAFERRARLSAGRKGQLDELGFDWDPSDNWDSAWETMFADLKRYKDKHGDCNVIGRKENRRLGAWVSKQRRLQLKRMLPSPRKARLDELGFDWVPRGRTFGPRDATWEAMFAELKRFQAKHGHCNVGQERGKNQQLSRWVIKQRHRKEALIAERRAQLDGLGFDWDPRDSAWEVMFADLKRYKERYGDCNVPAEWAENPQLASWVELQRAFDRRARLPAERKRQLDELGFDWDPRDSAWEVMFAELKRFRDEHGHCNVRDRWPENPQFGTWVCQQRVLQNRGKLSSARKARLDELGFDWDPRDSAWEAKFAELKRFRDEHGHCNVPAQCAENPQLGAWARWQRTRNKKGVLSSELKARLDELGFDWDPIDSAWEAKFAELKQHKERFGDCLVQQDSQLTTWVHHQRAFNRAGKLSPMRKTRLDALGFDWDPQANKRRAG